MKTHILLFTDILLLAAPLQMIAQVASGVTFTRVTTGPVATDVAYSFSGNWGDYDGDGYLDLIVGNGWGDTNVLYHNEQDGTFTRVTTGPIATTPSDAGGGAWGDYDNDGDIDLFLSNRDIPDIPDHHYTGFLFRNDGGGVFTRIQNGSMATNAAFSNGAAWGDYDNDGLLDLIVANSYEQNDFLYHNDGNDTFSSILNGPIPSSTEYSGVPSWVDYDADGNFDLYVSAVIGSARSWLYHNEGGGSFTTNVGAAGLGGLGDNGTDWGDYDNDGDLDLAGGVFNSTLASVVIHRNEGGGMFTRMSLEDFTPSVTRPFAATWGDYDNDGWLDLFCVTFRSGMAQNDLLYRNNGDGTFTRILEGEIVNTATWSSTWAAQWGDYDNDGFLDLFIPSSYITAPEPNLLYHNDGNSNHWLHVTCEGTDSNRSGIGAKVYVSAVIDGVPLTLLRQVSSGNGYNGCWLRLHFGLGDATMVDVVRVEWPSGTVQELTNVVADQILHVIEPPRIEWEVADTISWPASADAFELQSAIQATGPWVSAGETVVTNGNRITATLQTSNTASFYRLRMP